MPCTDRSSENQSKGGVGSWALIVFLFAIGIWPVALILLFIKLFGNDNKQRQAAMPPMNEEISGQTSAQANHAQTSSKSNRARAAAKNVVKPLAIKKSNARTLKIIGMIAMVVGILSAADPAEMVFYGDVKNYLWELLQYLAVFAGGVGMFCGGLKMDANMNRYARYLAVMGERGAISLEELSRKLGWSKRRVEKDLQKMIDRGYFGGRAYLNLELGYFVRSSQADEELKRRHQADQNPDQPPKETEEGFSGILRNIRRANDSIADPVLTAKIDRLEEITARIFRAVEEDPKKRGRIDTFLNYYLPTTQKLLNAYAEFDAAGVEGENLQQAKSRIEATMDAIVKGFEHQLDQLYKADALDVDSDIRVMESMLHRDTASVEKDFGLDQCVKSPSVGQSADFDFGATAAQRLPKEK